MELDLVIVLLAGLGLGSLLSLLSLRFAPSTEGEAAEVAGFCTGCAAADPLYAGLPLLGLPLRRGRCRHCGARLDPTPALVQASTLVAVWLVWRLFGPTPSGLVALLFVAILMYLALYDARYMLLPDVVTLPGLMLGLLVQPWMAGGTLLSSLQGALVGATLLLIFNEIGSLLRGGLPLGLGDIKMVAMLGAFLGLSGMLVALVVAILSGALVGVFALARGAAAQNRLPFGVFLSFGGTVALFFGPLLLASFVGLSPL